MERINRALLVGLHLGALHGNISSEKWEVIRNS